MALPSWLRSGSRKVGPNRIDTSAGRGNLAWRPRTFCVPVMASGNSGAPDRRAMKPAPGSARSRRASSDRWPSGKRTTADPCLSRSKARRRADDGKSMVGAHQPAPAATKQFSLGHEPDRPGHPAADQRRVHRADVVGHDQQRTRGRDVVTPFEVESRTEKHAGQEPCKTREEKIAQWRSVLREPAHHFGEDLLNRLALSSEDYSIGRRP